MSGLNSVLLVLSILFLRKKNCGWRVEGFFPMGWVGIKESLDPRCSPFHNSPPSKLLKITAEWLLCTVCFVVPGRSRFSASNLWPEAIRTYPGKDRKMCLGRNLSIQACCVFMRCVSQARAFFAAVCAERGVATCSEIWGSLIPGTHEADLLRKVSLCVGCTSLGHEFFELQRLLCVKIAPQCLIWQSRKNRLISYYSQRNISIKPHLCN